MIFSIAFFYSCTYSQTDNGWEKANLADVGIDAEKIFKLSQQINDGKYEGQRSLVIIKDGKLAYEAYYDDYDSDDLYRIYSVSKSVTSLLIGIALDKGLIKSVNEPILELLPQYSNIILDERKKKILLKHSLTMSPGFEWDEENIPFSDSKNSHTQMDNTDDWFEFVLTRELDFDPGRKWVYNTGNTHLLSGIIKEKTGLYANEFAEKYLFEPLGITEYEWNTDPMGYPCVGGSSGGLRLKTTDLAKIGQMILDGGKWKGKQILSEEWIKESTGSHIQATQVNQYGYQWWLMNYTIKGKRLEAICGFGYGGQSLQIFPDLNMVIAITSWGREPSAQTLPALLRILNATVKN